MIKPADEFALSNGSAPNAVRLAVNTCVTDALFVTAMENINDLLAIPTTLGDS